MYQGYGFSVYTLKYINVFFYTHSGINWGVIIDFIPYRV